jgi:hypothetical protein
VTTVVALGAWCEHVPPERAQVSPGSACFEVAEFAVLDDGRRILLHAERGFAVSRSTRDDPWTWLTAEGIRSDVLTTVLPDDQPAQEDHPYDWLRELLRQAGVEASPDELRAVPYVVELSDDVLARLSAARHGTT